MGFSLKKVFKSIAPIINPIGYFSTKGAIGAASGGIPGAIDAVTGKPVPATDFGYRDPTTGRPINPEFDLSSGAGKPSTIKVGGVTMDRPSFSDVLSGLTPAERFEAGNVNLDASRAATERALGEIGPTEGLRPEFQEILDRIEANRGEDVRAAGSAAQALAVRRGVQGSTIEQAGVAEATTGANRTARDLEVNVLNRNVELNQLNRTQRAQLLSSQAGIEAAAAQLEFSGGLEVKSLFTQMDQRNKELIAQLKSDELATVRNLIENNRDREVQMYLGEKGIAIQRENIAASREAAKAQQKTDLISSVISGGALAIAPF